MDELRTTLRRTAPAVSVVACLIVVFLLTPLLVILPIAVSSDVFLKFPPSGLSTRWFTEVFADPAWQASFVQSLKVATVATLVAVITGTSAALALRRATRARRLLRTAMIAPMVIPHLVLALGLYLGIQDLGGAAGIRTLMLGQAVLAAPMVYLTVASGLAAVDPALSRAALSLGHRWPSVLLRVELPLVARSIAGAAVLAFGLCFDESVLSYYLSPPGQETLPTRIWLEASQQASPAIAAVSSLVIGLAVALLGLSLVLTGTRRKS
jgi:putative spermidine/putrescine transport system permease protein